MGVPVRAATAAQAAGEIAVNWFRENRFLGTFLVVLGVATIAALWFLFSARGAWSDAQTQFQTDAAELGRLQRLTPFPNDENLRKMKAFADDYSAGVSKLKDELKARALPVTPLAPAEFQSRLRVAMGAVAEKARTNKVKLPDNFFLGFDEFASALPDTNAAPGLAQELAQVELLLNFILDAHVDAIASLRRVPPVANASPTPGAAGRPNAKATPAPALQQIERNVIEVSFASAPGAARRVLNQIATSDKQLYVVRLLHVRDEKDKGPPREQTSETGAAAGAATPQANAKPAPSPALNFIVGNEHIETAARIEMLRFNF